MDNIRGYFGADVDEPAVAHGYVVSLVSFRACQLFPSVHFSFHF